MTILHKKLLLLALCFFAMTGALQANNFYFNVKDYGAVGDGVALDTKAIQKTVDECAAIGGGKVIIPAGKFLTGPIFLKSNIEVEITFGAHVMLSENIVNTAVIEGTSGGVRGKVYASLFTGLDLENVAITGGGLLDGQGEVWWNASREAGKMREAAGIDKNDRRTEHPKGSVLRYSRPRIIAFYRCKNVKLKDFRIIDSPAWTIHPAYCENVVIENISIKQPYESPNTDGIDLDSSNGVHITNCYIDCGDDCIAIKSGYKDDGRKVNIPCQNIIISNCAFANGRAAVAIGSETAGGVRNVTISNCLFNGTFRGLRIKTKRGRGGLIENIVASNIIMENVDLGFSLDMVYGKIKDKKMPVNETTPHVRDLKYSNIVGKNIGKAMEIYGLIESPMENLSMDNIYIQSKKGLDCQYVNGSDFRNIKICVSERTPFFFRKLNDVVLDNLESNSGQNSVITLTDSKGVTIRNCNAPKGMDKFLKKENSTNIRIIN